MPKPRRGKRQKDTAVEEKKKKLLALKQKQEEEEKKKQKKQKKIETKEEKEDTSSEDDSSDGSDSAPEPEEDEYFEKTSKGKKKKPTMKDDSSSSSEEDDSDDDDDKKDNNSSSDDDDDEESDSDSDDNKKDNKQKKGFTDENATWLKPKQKKKGKEQLLSSDEEEDDKDDDEDEDDELLEIEKEAKIVDEEMKAEKEEAEEEMRRTISEHTSVYHLPTKEEMERDVDRVVPPSESRSHIESILEVLAEFKARREPGRARQEYIDLLGVYLSELYGYLPELVEYFLTMFSPAEAAEFIAASDKARPLVIRTNTLKTRRKDLAAALIKRGVSLDPLASWSKVGLKIIESPVPIGATPEYLSGMYMLQSAASMCPVIALSPEPKEKILDMSSAPGGKTSYIAQLMRNTGVIFANDLKPERQKATVANMHRLGVKNVITCSYDGRKLGPTFRNRFDRILLDAPCSGLGVISRDPSVKVQRTIADIKQCAHLQKELLLAAIDALKWRNTTGGVMVYSTCSVSVFENEEVVDYALSKRDIQIIDTGLDFGTPGFTRYQHKRFHPSVALTRRFYPHTVNMDGFFVCKIKKLSDGRPGQTKDQTNPEEEKAEKAVEKPKEEEEEVVERQVKKKSKKKGPKKRKSKEEEEEKAPKKDVHVSVPPQPKKKKQKTNAKVTKPRRPKKNTMDS